MKRQLRQGLRVAITPAGIFSTRASEVLFSPRVQTSVPPSPGVRSFRKKIRHVGLWAQSDVLLLIWGVRDLGWSQRLLARLGVPVVVQWIGTDVLRHAPHVGSFVRDRVWHWTVAPWLADELQALGLGGAEVVPLTGGFLPRTIPPFPSTFRVVAYVVEGREDFYGADFVLGLADRMPDIEFWLVPISECAESPPNVRCLGWVTEINEILDETVVFLRPTTHDGLSHTVLEALGRGRYVLWTYPIRGGELVTTIEAAERYLRDLQQRHSLGELLPNLKGRDEVEANYHPDAIADTAQRKLEQIAEQRWRRPPPRVVRSLSDLALRMLRLLLPAATPGPDSTPRRSPAPEPSTRGRTDAG